MRKLMQMVAVVLITACGGARPLAPDDVVDVGPDGGASASGLPCEVATVLNARCATCHSTAQFGVALKTYAQLSSASPTHPGQTVAQRALVRMKDGSMPPGGGLSAAELAIIENWVNAGAPAGDECGAADGGALATDAGEAKQDAGTPVDADAGDQGVTDAGPGNVSDGGVVVSGELPCEIEALVSARCAACHSAPTYGVALVTHAQLTAPSPAYPGKTVAERALARMKDGSMPPGGGVSSSEIALFESWVNTGAPAGTACGGGGGTTTDGGTQTDGGTSTDAGTMPGDGGMPTDGGTTSSPPPDLGAVCSSGSYSNVGRGVEMKPGQACIACHASRSNDTWDVMGTVYPSLHEPDNCKGPSAVTIEITGHDGRVYTGTSNAVGNFLFDAPGLVLPYTAKVKANGRERAMFTPQMSGDCNACHSQNGLNGAPGRVVAP